VLNVRGVEEDLAALAALVWEWWLCQMLGRKGYRVFFLWSSRLEECSQERDEVESIATVADTGVGVLLSLQKNHRDGVFACRLNICQTALLALDLHNFERLLWVSHGILQRDGIEGRGQTLKKDFKRDLCFLS
jgi:hypothetical protein